jgi:hypothetical protein
MRRRWQEGHEPARLGEIAGFDADVGQFLAVRADAVQEVEGAVVFGDPCGLSASQGRTVDVAVGGREENVLAVRVQDVVVVEVGDPGERDLADAPAGNVERP